MAAVLRHFKRALALAAMLAMVLGTIPQSAFAAVVRNTYIVQVADGHSPEVRAAIAALGETPHDELTEVLDGFVLDLTDTEAATLKKTPFVLQVVQDMPMSLLDVQSPTPSWGLDRIDQASRPTDSAYNFPASAGAGVRIYVVDTGVMASNPDFAGRMLPGVDMLGQGLEAADCHGHGTHVAGTAAGTKYGVAKKAWIVPIRVLGCGGMGSWSYFISAMDWIIANNPAGTPAVMSASIGGGFYNLVNLAVDKLYQAGITPVIAAGNDNIDACGVSPASAKNAITVGASDANDARASFSNWGECVDVFAPGVSIISDKNTDPTGYATMSGTSMATPHVSGLAALYLGLNKTASPAQVTAAIENGGLAGAITGAQSAAGNILINNKFTRADIPVTPGPVNPPTAVVASAITSTSANILWSAPFADAPSTAPDSYLVEYKLVTDLAWKSIISTTTSASLTGLTEVSNYQVRVISIAGDQKSAPTSTLQFTTLGKAPDAPTALLAGAIYGDQIVLSWTKPLNSNGSPITGYYVEKLTNGVWSNYTVTGALTTTVKTLTPLTTYSFRVRAYNAFGSSSYSNVLVTATSATTPTTPVGITFSNITGTSATVNWVASPQLDSAVPIKYTVTLLSRFITSFGKVLATYTTSSTSFNITGLQRTTAYGVTVTAASGALLSPASAQYVFSTLTKVPTAPTTPVVNKTQTGATISWSSPMDNGGSAITSYQIEKQNADGSWNVVANLSATTFSYDVPLPARATTDQYRITAGNINGYGPATAISVSTPATVTTAPQNLADTRVGNIVTLSWAAPADNGGAPLAYYTVWQSMNGGTTWTAYSVQLTGLNYNVQAPAKGLTTMWAVTARNAAGNSPMSNIVSESTATTAPSIARNLSFSYVTADQLQIAWASSLDNGGLAVSYLVERQNDDLTWQQLATTVDTKYAIARDLPGVVVKIRVTALNSIGSATPLAAQFLTPYVQASAPQNFTAIDNGVIVTTSWTAPTELGGSTIARYLVQYSLNGTVWYGYNTASGTVLSLNVPRPAKGTSATYRVVAVTGYGPSLTSDVVVISAPLTIPATPVMKSFGFALDGTMNLAWSIPADNGGTALTAIILERSNDNINWTEQNQLSPSTFALNMTRELPGVRLYFRVRTVNSIGQSLNSNVLTLLTPYIKSTAPLNFAGTDTGTNIAFTWSAPENTGGSPVSSYSIRVSKDGGATWAQIAAVAGTALAANAIRPAKGLSWSYLVVARTAFGDSVASDSVSFTVAATAPAAPLTRSLVLAADKIINLTWAAPTDIGGSPLTSFVVETSSNNIVWSQFATVTPTTLTLAIAYPGPGVRMYFRIKAVNAIGTSANSSAITIMTPYLLATSARSLRADLVSSRLQLSWQAPENIGGAPTVQYRIEYNLGAGWLTKISTTALLVQLPLQTKGVTVLYRVVAITAAGATTPSGEISVVG